MGEPVFFPAKDRLLRDDVSWLGALLGEVLREQGPTELFPTVERARLAARRRHREDAGAEAELATILSGLEPRLALEVVRAFSAYFGVVNMAERVHRIRRRVDYLRTGRRHAPPTVREVGETLLEHVAELHSFYGREQGVRIARKHLAWYCKGRQGAAAFWNRVNRVEEAERQLALVRGYFESLADGREDLELAA